MKKKEIQTKIDKLRNQLWKIEERSEARKTKKLSGKYFKFKNCYSCPKDESDYWLIYRKIISVNRTNCIALDIQKDKNGKITIEKSEIYSNMTSWIEINKNEFDAEFEKLKKQIGLIELPLLKKKAKLCRK